nr:hypothetical protein [Tanacetum cinerariifolium]
MPVTRQGTNDAMTPESIQAMINRAIQRYSTHTQDDASQSLGGGLRRPVQPARVCSYTDFMKCQPSNFKGTEGIVGLSQWLEKMESVFHISGCAIDNQVKFATCTLLGHDAAYAMTWGTLKKKLMDKYCPKGEIKKLEIELWNLRVKGNDRQNESKRKKNDSLRNIQQQPHKNQNVARAYTAGPGEKKVYTGDLPLCTKCNYHHTGQCAPKCKKCKRYGHTTTDCQNFPKLKNHGNGSGNGVAQGRVYALGGRDANPDSNIVRVPFGREMLFFQGNGDNQRKESRLNIISCTKAQEYLSKGCDVFLANTTTKEAKDKSEGKRLEDVSIVRDFPEVFPKDLPGAVPVARAPY